MTLSHLKIDWVCGSNPSPNDSVWACVSSYVEAGLSLLTYPGRGHCTGASLGDTIEIKEGKAVLLNSICNLTQGAAIDSELLLQQQPSSSQVAAGQ